MVQEPIDDRRRLAAGEPEAFARLYDRLGGRLYRCALAILQSAEDAQDAVQDTFVGLVKSRERLPQVHDLDAYVFGALHHVIGSRLRFRRRDQQKWLRLAQEKRSQAGALEASRHDRDVMASRTVTAATTESSDLGRALCRLPAEQREMIALKFDGALTLAQIASALGISPGTAASRYRYGLEKLRTMLHEEQP